MGNGGCCAIPHSPCTIPLSRFPLDLFLTLLRHASPVAAILFFYAVVSNVALAVVPHEPVVAWYGPRLGVWTTALVATAGTVAASWMDYRVFSRYVAKLWRRSHHTFSGHWVGWASRGFARVPFAMVAASGLTPLPFFPFKVMAFVVGYPMGRYLAAVAAGRLPRYLLLAWLGAALQLPTWPFVIAFVLLLLPSLRGVRWQQRNGN